MHTLDRPRHIKKAYTKPILNGKNPFVNKLLPGREITNTQNPTEYIKREENVENFLKNTYPNELKILENANLSKNWTESVLHSFKLFTEDPGLSRESRFLNEDQTEEVVPGVSVLNRASLLHKTIENLANLPPENQDMSVMVLDIANLRQADLIVDNSTSKNRYADIILNKVAAKIDDFVGTFLSTDESIGENVKISFGRYGGDEFVVTICGKISEQDKESICELIRKEISTITGKYLEAGGTINIHNVNLKGDRVETIEMPRDSYEKVVFLHFFKRGLIFDSAQIQKFMTRFTNLSGDIDEDLLENYLSKEESDYAIYPIDASSLEEKISYLTKIKPELGLLVKVAQKYDRENETKTAIGVLNIVENIIFDPLLREHMLSFTEIYDSFVRNKVDQLYIFDLKFIKEINDNLGLVDGDEAIKSCWDQIKPNIAKEDASKISFGRRGGTFYLSVKTGEQISQETSQKLENLDSITIFNETSNPVTVPIGKAYQDFRDVKKQIFKPEIKEKVEIAYEFVDVDFYTKLLEIIEKTNFYEITQNKFDLAIMIKKSLSGKRKEERLGILRKVIRDKYKNDSEKQDLVMGKIVNLTF
jgi:GGDEF domain-containing protein